MFTPIEGIHAAPPITGLLASAPPVAEDGARWQDGLAWVPERCGADYQLVVWCSADLADYTPHRTAGRYYRPPTARWAQECSTLGGPLDLEQIRRVAEASTSFAVARELWAGEAAADDSFNVLGVTYQNAWLASAAATVVTPGAGVGLLGAFGALEQAAMEATMGQQVMLHVPPRVVPLLESYLRRDGPRLLTLLDNIVIADAGYPGSGPAGQVPGATVWAYGTSLVQTRIGELFSTTDPKEMMDRQTNTVRVWAERVFAALFDPCAHVAVELTL